MRDPVDTRGRVVMLVDNGVLGDSRVQKAARSAADAGWSVTLLGRSPNGEAQSWQLGRAQVRLLPMGDPRSAGHPVRRSSRAVLRSAAKRVLGRSRRPVEAAYARFWVAVQRERAWRRLEPGLWGYEKAYGPVVDALAPDLIHAHDFRMLGVAARAKVRARERGHAVKLLWDAHEFLPGIKPWVETARWLPAHRAYEREYAPYADAAVTVSAELAGLLRREHGLARLPDVVLNAPAAGDLGGGPAGELRARHGIGPDVPLLVYSGSAAPQRGLGLLVEALPLLPGVHVALVVNQPDGPYVGQLVERARALGVADRLHAGGYVPHDRVVGLLAGADAGVIPIHHWPNHEIALITKFFEYSHARLPILVSDVRTMAATVRETGQGEVFRAEDVAGFVRAARAVLAEPGRYRAAYDRPGLLAGWTWEAQAEVLDRVYSELVPAVTRN
jgi:glycosyltransferase involved in cell wall biosynthesis